MANYCRVGIEPQKVDLGMIPVTWGNTSLLYPVCLLKSAGLLFPCFLVTSSFKLAMSLSRRYSLSLPCRNIQFVTIPWDVLGHYSPKLSPICRNASICYNLAVISAHSSPLMWWNILIQSSWNLQWSLAQYLIALVCTSVQYSFLSSSTLPSLSVYNVASSFIFGGMQCILSTDLFLVNDMNIVLLIFPPACLTCLSNSMNCLVMICLL